MCESSQVATVGEQFDKMQELESNLTAANDYLVQVDTIKEEAEAAVRSSRALVSIGLHFYVSCCALALVCKALLTAD